MYAHIINKKKLFQIFTEKYVTVFVKVMIKLQSVQMVTFDKFITLLQMVPFDKVIT